MTNPCFPSKGNRARRKWDPERPGIVKDAGPEQCVVVFDDDPRQEIVCINDHLEPAPPRGGRDLLTD
jgi:hypothetical protein